MGHKPRQKLYILILQIQNVFQETRLSQPHYVDKECARSEINAS